MAETKPFTVVGNWVGVMTGTTRGGVRARVKIRNGIVTGRILIEEHAFGPALGTFRGEENDGGLALRLVEYRSLAPAAPLSGILNLVVDEEQGTARGDWRTDIGTSGQINLRKADGDRWIWWFRTWSHSVRYFLRSRATPLYLGILLFVAAGVILDAWDLDPSALILLLLPAPYVFRVHLLTLFQAFRVRRLGPLEIQLEAGTTVSTPSLTDPMIRLDVLFVPRTKLMLLLLFWLRPMTREQFEQAARTLGVPESNIEVTLQAIVSENCATVAGDEIVLSDLGANYIVHLTRQPAQ